MTQDNTQNTTATQAAQDAAQNVTPQMPETIELPPQLQTTDTLLALLMKAAKPAG